MMNFEGVETLPPPYEIVELEPGKPQVFDFTDYKIGKVSISPRWPGAPPIKEVLAIRLYAREGAKEYYPFYWDLTPARLTHHLAGMLTKGVPEGKKLKITRDIAGPRAHFGVEWVD